MRHYEAHGHPRPRPRGAHRRSRRSTSSSPSSARTAARVEKVDIWGRRRLAYEIDKKAEGIYAVIDLQAEPATVKELDRQLNLNEAVLRTKVMRPDSRALSSVDNLPVSARRRREHRRRHDRRSRGRPAWQATPSSPSSATSSTTPSCASPPRGAAVAKFRIASTPRFFDRQTNEWKDGEALFLSCTVWRQAAENVAESLQQGHARHRPGPAEAAVVRDPRGREAHRLRARGRRGRPVACEYATAKVTQDPASGGGGRLRRRRRRRPAAATTRGPGRSGGRRPAAAGRRAGRDPWGAPGVAPTSRRSDPPLIHADAASRPRNRQHPADHSGAVPPAGLQ